MGRLKRALPALCAALLALGAGDARPAAAFTAPGGQSGAPVALSLMAPYEREDEKNSMIRLTDRFELMNPSVDLQIQFYPREDYWRELYLFYSQQSLPDLAVMNNVMIPAFHELGILHDLSEYVDAPRDGSPSPRLIDSASVDGACYGFPFTLYTYALLCNRDLLDKYDLKPPQDWDQFMGACEALLREPADSFALAAAPGEELTNGFLQFMYATDATLRNLRGKGAMRTFQLFSDLAGKRLIARDCVNWNQADLTRKFARREVAMIVTSSAQIPFLIDLEPEFEWSATPVPRPALGGQEKSVFSAESVTVLDDERLTEIYRFFDYLSSEEAVSARAEDYGSLPVRADVPSRLFADDGPYAVFSGRLPVSQPLPSMVAWQNISQTIQDAVLELFIGEKPVEQIAQEAYVLVNTYIIDG